MAGTTLKDVAAAAGVSISTASRSLSGNPAISESTRQRVKDTAVKLNYRPNAQARALIMPISPRWRQPLKRPPINRV